MSNGGGVNGGAPGTGYAPIDNTNGGSSASQSSGGTFTGSVDNRNKPGGNMNDIFIFNDVISSLGLLEIPLSGRSYTWSDMQADPLLEQLDWVFTSANWISVFPNTQALVTAKNTSDHAPIKIQIATSIPKSNVFRFENYWLKQPGLLDQVILFLDKLEELRLLNVPELRFRLIFKDHVAHLLHGRELYWKQRFKQNSVLLGGENTKFFHAMATERICQEIKPQAQMGSMDVSSNPAGQLLLKIFIGCMCADFWGGSIDLSAINYIINTWSHLSYAHNVLEYMLQLATNL
uniref:Retrotransposon protein, putative, LINE subclass n=1 Tax=Oryza sativa subsp. japonica TaxID=39947 RepID=Q2QWG6_ORYSJ|nr:retrotransposon protein, putative, LINE subclass [Oryza sativa Japonica Group]